MTDHDRATRGESGFAVIWYGVLMAVLLGIAAFAVDLVHGYAVGDRAQNAADAASLAGTVFLPDNPAGAKARAIDMATQNGFVADANTTVVAQTTSDDHTLLPTQIRVKITTHVPTFLAGIFGIHTMNVTRVAVGDYDQPVSMGSPSNSMGNQPDCVAACTNGDPNPQYWLNIAGPTSNKRKGDRFAARTCAAGTDNCSAGASTDYVGSYLFVVHNEVAGTSLDIAGFDAGFVSVGDHCDGKSAKGAQSHLDTLYTNSGLDPRYQTGNTSYCTGDVWFDDDDPTVNGPTTTFRFFEPDQTPTDVSDNVEITSCALTLPGYSGDLWTRYQAELANPALPRLVTGYFRKWVTLCHINNAIVGDYVVQVSTSGGAGHNRYSMRVAQNGLLSSPTVRMYAPGRLPIYANNIGADTRFYLARVLPGASNRVLHVVFYDTGDASQPGVLQVLPPAESNLTTFAGCQYTPPPGNTSGPPMGTFAATNADCSVANVQAATGWDGQLVEWTVPIPAGYSCAYLDPAGCWVRMRFSYPASATASDTTTWSATLEGNPVRIVQ